MPQWRVRTWYRNELDYNRINIDTLPASLNIFTASGRNLLNTAFNNKGQLVQAAGFSLPYPQFPVTSSLAQALRPYPQYTGVATSSGGDHSGHSNYQSAVFKVTRRYAAGMVVDSSYVFSKLFTDAESAWGNNSASMNAYNCRLDKAVPAATARTT